MKTRLKKIILKLDKYLSAKLKKNGMNSREEFNGYTFYRGKLFAYSYCYQELYGAGVPPKWLLEILYKFPQFEKYTKDCELNEKNKINNKSTNSI